MHPEDELFLSFFVFMFTGLLVVDGGFPLPRLPELASPPPAALYNHSLPILKLRSLTNQDLYNHHENISKTLIKFYLFLLELSQDRIQIRKLFLYVTENHTSGVEKGMNKGKLMKGYSLFAALISLLL